MSNELESEGAMVMNLESFGVDGHGAFFLERIFIDRNSPKDTAS
jgi:hypothetical protein